MGFRFISSSDRRLGVTFVELIVVMAIMAMTAAMVLSAAARSSGRSRILRAQADLSLISSALESYRRTFGDYPHTARNDALIQSLLGRLGPTGAVVASRSFLSTETLLMIDDRDALTDATSECRDPWDSAYEYAYKSATPWTPSAFVLYSRGPDMAHAALLTGGRVDEGAAANLDNVYSSR